MKPYYVYELVDPRNSLPFYVGKGKEKRGWQHGKDALRGALGRKCDRIREIRSAGLEHEVRIVREFRSEAAAYAYEVKLIAKYGLESLTNETSGGRAPDWVGAVDSDKERGQTVIYCWLRLMTKTKGLTLEPILRYCGREVPIQKELVTRIQVWFWQVFDRRGKDWVVGEAKRHNINLNLLPAV